MTPFDIVEPKKCVCRDPRAPSDLFRRIPNGSLGILGHLMKYVVMKYIERGHRLTYDPSRCIQTNQMHP